MRGVAGGGQLNNDGNHGDGDTQDRHNDLRQGTELVLQGPGIELDQQTQRSQAQCRAGALPEPVSIQQPKAAKQQA
jgi:hypothetical protein